MNVQDVGKKPMKMQIIAKFVVIPLILFKMKLYSKIQPKKTKQFV